MTKKVALITGSNRGIGRGIALQLAQEGADVVVAYHNRLSEAQQTVSLIEQTILQQSHTKNNRVMAVQMSVQNRKNVRSAITQIHQKFGSINILVNNAATAQEKPFETITDQDWDNMLAINLRGPFTCIQEIIPDMVTDGWGRIINISSIGGQWGGFNQVHYAASKAALINLTRSIAKIYSNKGVTCNAISPGLVATEMSANELNSEQGKTKIANIPVGRIGSIDEVAAIAAFLIKENAGYITGQTINANGGMYFD